MAPENFLIIRLAAIGDVVMASTVARRVRDERPRARITWLCGATAAPLVRQFSEVDEIIAIDEHRLLRGGFADRLGVLLPLWKRLRRERFTDVLLLHPDPRYRIMTAPLTGVRERRPSKRDAFGDMNPIQGRYFGDEFARLLDDPGSRGPIVGHFPLSTLRPVPRYDSRSSRQPRVALVPGGTRNVLRESLLKRWPVEHYSTLARAFADDGCEVVLVGDGADEWVRPYFAGIQVTDLLGKTSLPETLGVFTSCDVVVAHDTGPMHLARLARAPLVALFGPTMPSQFVPADDTTTVLWGGAHLACRPCYDGREFADCRDNQCMSSIAVDVVLTTARTVLARHSSPARRQIELAPAAETASR